MLKTRRLIVLTHFIFATFLPTKRPLSSKKWVRTHFKEHFFFIEAENLSRKIIEMFFIESIFIETDFYRSWFLEKIFIEYLRKKSESEKQTQILSCVLESLR
jgi:hypothetical protein